MVNVLQSEINHLNPGFEPCIKC